MMSQAEEGVYLVGMATGDVTPPVGTPMAGFAVRSFHSSTGVYHPLRAVAVTVDDGVTPMLLVSVEWLGFYDLASRVRARLSRVTGIPAENIVLIGTHTHCGPAIRASDARTFGWIDHAYIEQAIQTMERLAERAWRQRFRARISAGSGRCSIAMSRRAPDPQRPGRVKNHMEPNPAGRTDHEVAVLAVESVDDGVLRGVLFNYACHTTARKGLLIGGDFAGFAYDYLQEAFLHAQPCFLQGCGGDQKVRPVAGERQFGSRSIEQVREVGHELGAAVAAVIESGEMSPVRGAIELRQRSIDLHTEPLDPEGLDRAIAADETPAYVRRWAEHHRARLAQGLPEERRVPFEVQTIRFGSSLAMVTLAAEMTVEHGLRLKAELGSAFDHVMPLAYTNEIVGYVPVRRQYPEWGYEVLAANQLHERTGRYVPETEDRIHRCVHELLGLPAADASGDGERTAAEAVRGGEVRIVKDVALGARQRS